MAFIMRFFRSLYSSSPQSSLSEKSLYIKKYTDSEKTEIRLRQRCQECETAEERLPFVMGLDAVRRTFNDDFESFNRVFDPIEERDQIPPPDDQMPWTLREVYPEMYLC